MKALARKLDRCALRHIGADNFIDPRQGRAVATSRHKIINSRCRPNDYAFHSARLQVSHPSVKAQFRCLLSGPGTIPHALYTPRYGDMNGFVSWG